MRELFGQSGRVVQLPVEVIDPCPFQARSEFKTREIKKLAVSILQNGLLQPISVRPTGDGRYQLIAGERRLRACKMAGLERIPALVYHFEDEKTAALSLLENLQREQLNPFEQARALRALLDLWDCTQEAGARRLGMAQPTLANKLRLLTLTAEQEQICVDHNLTERHARAVLRLPTAELRTKALRTVASRGYNVQQTEALVARCLDKKPAAPRHRCRVMVRDVRIFVNTIERAVKLMTGSGIPATTRREDGEGYIQYTVRIPTARDGQGAAQGSVQSAAQRGEGEQTAAAHGDGQAAACEGPQAADGREEGQALDARAEGQTAEICAGPQALETFDLDRPAVAAMAPAGPVKLAEPVEPAEKPPQTEPAGRKSEVKDAGVHGAPAGPEASTEREASAEQVELDAEWAGRTAQTGQAGRAPERASRQTEAEDVGVPEAPAGRAAQIANVWPERLLRTWLALPLTCAASVL